MKKLLATAMLSVSLIGASAWAQDGRTTMKTDSVFDSPINFSARAGILDYSAAGSDTTDFLTGLTADINMGGLFGSTFQYGVSTGAYWSPLGVEADAIGEGTAVIVPVNAFVGYDLGNKFLISAIGGAQWFANGDRSVNDGDMWSPNAGAELGYDISNSLAVTARANWVFADDNTPFMGTLGLAFPLG